MSRAFLYQPGARRAAFAAGADRHADAAAT
jgi:hypothetical protein